MLELTGITDTDVAGHRIDEARVAALLAPSVLVIAHNARFDRKYLEARLPAFCEKHWACSCDDIPWDKEGLSSRRLKWVGYRPCGMFYDAHRADRDVAMGVRALAQSLPKSRRPALGALLDAARTKTVVVWAAGSDKSTRFALKKRGYRWNSGEDGRPMAWWREIPESGLAEEIAWLETPAVYGGPSRHRVQVLDARIRYSLRSERVEFAD